MQRLFAASRWLCLAAFLTTPLSAVELEYHFQSGEGFTYQVSNTAKPPTQGTIVSNLTYDFTATGNGEPANLSVGIDGDSSHFPVVPTDATFDLAPNGQASNLASADLNDPVAGAFVKNAPGFFFPLPGGDIQVGDSWQALSTFYFPPLDMPGSFTKLKTTTTFKYAGTEQAADGRTLHVLETKAVHAPGNKQKVNFSGKALFDAEAGRLTAMEMSGIVKVKVSFLWVKVPTSLTLTEAAPNL